MKSRSQLVECCRKAIAPEGKCTFRKLEVVFGVGGGGIVERQTEEEDRLEKNLSVLVSTVDP